ncbi:MAG: hypothetical protein DRJ40_10705 [Thermoprotei archaeon]|nr:MAG: hypothetical protein DRJ40_10705 [Thermoprotei archaeon]
MTTPYEREILKLIAMGYDTVEAISRALNLSPYDTYELLESLVARGYLVKEWSGFIVKKPRYKLTSKGLEAIGEVPRKYEVSEVVRPVPTIVPTIGRVLTWLGLGLVFLGLLTLFIAPIFLHTGKITSGGGAVIWIFPFPPVVLTGPVSTAVSIIVLIFTALVMFLVFRFLLKALR